MRDLKPRDKHSIAVLSMRLIWFIDAMRNSNIDGKYGWLSLSLPLFFSFFLSFSSRFLAREWCTGDSPATKRTTRISRRTNAESLQLFELRLVIGDANYRRIHRKLLVIGNGDGRRDGGRPSKYIDNIKERLSHGKIQSSIPRSALPASQTMSGGRALIKRFAKFTTSSEVSAFVRESTREDRQR